MLQLLLFFVVVDIWNQTAALQYAKVRTLKNVYILQRHPHKYFNPVHGNIEIGSNDHFSTTEDNVIFQTMSISSTTISDSLTTHTDIVSTTMSTTEQTSISQDFTKDGQDLTESTATLKPTNINQEWASSTTKEVETTESTSGGSVSERSGTDINKKESTFATTPAVEVIEFTIGNTATEHNDDVDVDKGTTLGNTFTTRTTEVDTLRNPNATSPGNEFTTGSTAIEGSDDNDIDIDTEATAVYTLTNSNATTTTNDVEFTKTDSTTEGSSDDDDDIYIDIERTTLNTTTKVDTLTNSNVTTPAGEAIGFTKESSVTEGSGNSSDDDDNDIDNIDINTKSTTSRNTFTTTAIKRNNFTNTNIAHDGSGSGWLSTKFSDDDDVASGSGHDADNTVQREKKMFVIDSDFSFEEWEAKNDTTKQSTIPFIYETPFEWSLQKVTSSGNMERITATASSTEDLKSIADRIKNEIGDEEDQVSSVTRTTNIIKTNVTTLPPIANLELKNSSNEEVARDTENQQIPIDKYSEEGKFEAEIENTAPVDADNGIKSNEKSKYDVIPKRVLNLDRGNFDEDYYVIIDGYDYPSEPLKNATYSTTDSETIPNEIDEIQKH